MMVKEMNIIHGVISILAVRTLCDKSITEVIVTYDLLDPIITCKECLRMAELLEAYLHLRQSAARE